MEDGRRRSEVRQEANPPTDGSAVADAQRSTTETASGPSCKRVNVQRPTPNAQWRLRSQVAAIDLNRHPAAQLVRPRRLQDHGTTRRRDYEPNVHPPEGFGAAPQTGRRSRVTFNGSAP